MKAIIVQTTTNNIKEAKKIAKILLEKNLAACIHVSAVDSLYTWNNEFCEEVEYLLNIKTKKENFKKIKRKIKELHSYHVPEIVSFKINELSKEYEKFIEENC